MNNTGDAKATYLFTEAADLVSYSTWCGNLLHLVEGGKRV